MIALLITLLFGVASLAEATVYTAATCSRTDVQAKFDLATATGDIVEIPAGTCAWTAQATWTAPANAILRGAGSTTTTGGGDVTVITDDMATNAPLLVITTHASGTFRMHSLTVQGGSGGVKFSGMIYFGGSSSQARIDHVHLNTQSYSPTQTNRAITIAGNVAGVMDHAVVDLQGASAIYILNGEGASGQGNEAWAADTNYGSGPTWWYIEDSIITGTPASHDTRITDCYTGGKIAIRFSTLVASAGAEDHATGHSADDRGCRAHEYYGNTHSQGVGQTEPNFDMLHIGGGPALVWGNAAVQVFKNVYDYNVTRKNSDTYNQSDTPTRWSHCGPPRRTGTINTSGLSVTKTGGTDFDVAWPAGTQILINGASTSYRIASVSSGTALTLQGPCGTNGSGQAMCSNPGTQTGVAYAVGSAWDANTDAVGYACLDQPGRGKGDLLTGSFSSKVNQTTGTIAWPNQALEPIYIWSNNVSIAPGWGGNLYRDNTAGRVVDNRDLFKQASGIQVSSSSPFNGTTGTGWGTLANRPSSCTPGASGAPGVGYFATDQGSWNQSTSNPYGVQQNGADGLFYRCTATNTWTLYYTPYTYPHPLQEAGGGGGTPITGRIRIRY